jgi:acetyl-CoA carboxylase carboxyl transferase subunit alpha
MEGNGRVLTMAQVTMTFDSNGSSSSATPGKPVARHVLDFEKPVSKLEQQVLELEALQTAKGIDYSTEIRQLRTNYTALLRKTYDNLSPWETVQVARHPQRPLFRDYVDIICREFRELHGDRGFRDDRAIKCGLARLGGHKVMLIGTHKGKDTKEKVRCYFGLAHPEGYRKALRCMKLAEKFGLPVVTLIDTAGAYPGIGAEERGQAESIARNLLEMSRLKTPIVSIVTGEGGSGGALGIGVADRVAMMEHAWYSVISPEGCSGILWKGGENAGEAAAALKLTSRDLKQLGVVDQVVPEPLGGAHRDTHTPAHNLEPNNSKTCLAGAREACADDGGSSACTVSTGVSVCGIVASAGKMFQRLKHPAAFPELAPDVPESNPNGPIGYGFGSRASSFARRLVSTIRPRPITGSGGSKGHPLLSDRLGACHKVKRKSFWCNGLRNLASPVGMVGQPLLHLPEGDERTLELAVGVAAGGVALKADHPGEVKTTKMG